MRAVEHYYELRRTLGRPQIQSPSVSVASNFFVFEREVVNLKLIIPAALHLYMKILLYELFPG